MSSLQDIRGAIQHTYACIQFYHEVAQKKLQQTPGFMETERSELESLKKKVDETYKLFMDRSSLNEALPDLMFPMTEHYKAVTVYHSDLFHKLGILNFDLLQASSRRYEQSYAV